MGSIWEVLLILGFIGFSIFKQVNKSLKDTADEQRPAVPMGMEEVFPEMEPTVEPIPTLPPVQKQVPKKSSTQTASSPKRRIHAPIPIEDKATLVLQETEPTAQDFDVHSIEEVRKGVIWSEILNRKY